MNFTPIILKTILLSAIFATCLQSQSYSEEKSKYFGAKLIELDTLIDQSANKYVQFMVTNSLRPIGQVNIRRFRTPSTAVEVATANAKLYAESGKSEILSKPTSGWFATDDSTYEGTHDSNGTKMHNYIRVMKSGADCYLINGSMSEDNWKANGRELSSLIDSFKFN